MTDQELIIDGSTKVAVLLDRYPELEDVLIGYAAPFKKLRNPILRRSVAKIASLQQAAAVARVPVSDLVNALRVEVGQDPVPDDDASAEEDYFSIEPDWFRAELVVMSIDERQEQNPNKMAVTRVLRQAKDLRPGEIVELITTFLPAPGIDVMRRRGFLFWCLAEDENLVRTYFSLPADRAPTSR